MSTSLTPPVADRNVARSTALGHITAAGHAELRNRGRTITLTDPRLMSKAEAAARVTGVWPAIFSRLPFDSAVPLARS